MRSPADASPAPSRAQTHGLGPMWIATPSSHRTCTDYSLPVSRRTIPSAAEPVDGYLANTTAPSAASASAIGLDKFLLISRRPVILYPTRIEALTRSEIMPKANVREQLIEAGLQPPHRPGSN